MDNTAVLTDRDLAQALLNIKAVTLSPDAPFTWASGLQSPIYCDNRQTLGYPALRRQITAAFAARVAAHNWTVDVVAGTATAGIPHAAWLADRLGKPMAYVRSAPKGHGKENQIEGRVRTGDVVLLVEDLISTGGSALKAVDALRAAGAEVAAVVAIFTYGFPETAQRFTDAQVDLSVLSDFEALQAVALAEGLLSPAAASVLADWQQAPEAWSVAHS